MTTPASPTPPAATEPKTCPNCGEKMKLVRHGGKPTEWGCLPCRTTSPLGWTGDAKADDGVTYRVMKIHPLRQSRPFEFSDDDQPEPPPATALPPAGGDYEEVATLANGCRLYRKPNGIGGHVYASDEIGGGVVVWDTCLVASDTLLVAVTAENARLYREAVEERKAKGESNGSKRGQAVERRGD